MQKLIKIFKISFKSCLICSFISLILCCNLYFDLLILIFSLFTRCYFVFIGEKIKLGCKYNYWYSGGERISVYQMSAKGIGIAIVCTRSWNNLKKSPLIKKDKLQWSKEGISNNDQKEG